MANRISHRYNRLPLLPSGPGGVRQELVVSICRRKVTDNKRHDKMMILPATGKRGLLPDIQQTCLISFMTQFPLSETTNKEDLLAALSFKASLVFYPFLCGCVSRAFYPDKV